jgi:teichuronic acid exporter
LVNAGTLKAETLSGVKWNAIGQIGRQVIAFLVSLVLARLLTPKEFGVIAMLLVFQEVANALVNSGLNAPLIQAKDISSQDCSTIFHFNIAVGLACYFVLIMGAPHVATFCGEPQLNALIKYYGLTFLIHAFGNVQVGLLVRELNYKQLNLIPLAGIALAGIVAVPMALRGHGVYSLLAQHISYALVTTALYWIYSSWRPTFVFSRTSFRRLFGFGSKVLLVSLLDKMLATVDNLIIGKLQGTDFLGHYSRGKATRDLPITNIVAVITSLVFPLFSRIESPDGLRAAHSRFVGVVAYLSAPFMVAMALLAEPLIVVLYSDKWAPSAFFLQLFCIFGITIPLNSILVQTVLSSGRSGMFLRLELLKKTVLLVSMGIGALLGPLELVLALCVGHYLALFISVFFVAGLLGTPARSILGDMLPGVALAVVMGVPMYLISLVPWRNDLWHLLVSAAVGFFTYVGLSGILGCRDYVFVKTLVIERLFPATARGRS